MKKYKVEGISTLQDYKIRFIKLFIVCVCIMVIEKLLFIFEDSPEIIVNGDLIYHAIMGVTSICSQLASSIAAAIIFYYCAEFINKKKVMGKYVDFRREILFLLYNHMEILTKLESFNEISLNNSNCSVKLLKILLTVDNLIF
jgi:hypothetical protein